MLNSRKKFSDEYFISICYSDLAGCVSGIQNLVCDILNSGKYKDSQDSLALFINNALEANVPLNWLTGELLYDNLGEKYIPFDYYSENKEEIENEQFVSSYRNALYYSKLHSCKDDVFDVVSKVLLKDDTLDYNDSLVIFIKNSLMLNNSITFLTGNKLNEAYRVILPGVKIITDAIKLDINVNNFEGLNFVYENYMLVFSEGKIIYCDISNCDKSHIVDKNDQTFNVYKKILNLDDKMTEQFIKELFEQCKFISLKYFSNN
ncbi:MAG: hypothetical protein PHN31_05275 [Candidatus Gracilibacteria bacterium]|nr:hypothetical protein [Candidatus Gracilibacteria bacterium]